MGDKLESSSGRHLDNNGTMKIGHRDQHEPRQHLMYPTIAAEIGQFAKADLE